jgi:hypothetical protein
MATTPTPGKPAAAPVHPAPAQAAAPAAATEKTPKEAKPKKEKKEGAVARPRLPKFPEDHLITVMKPNAKSRTANDRFMRYTTGMTVKAYVEKIKEDFKNRTTGQIYADMRWDEEHKFIHVGPTVVPVPPPEPKPEAKAAPAAGAQASA